MRADLGKVGMVATAVIVQLAVLVLAHDLVYLARYGSRFGEALVHAGHGDAWRTAVASSVVLGGMAALVAIARLVRLRLQLRRLQATGNAGGRLQPRALVRTWLRIGPALAISTVVLLTVQENLERAAIGGAGAGIGILLTPEYAGGLWIALAVGFAVGLAVALVAWRFEVLAARLRAARAVTAHTRAHTAPRPATVVDRPAASILGRRSALRAPPAAAPAS